MAVSQTTRLGVYTWSSGGDEFTRDQMTDSHQALEDRVALFLAGTFAARPAAGSGNARGFYLATDQNILYYSDGSNWYSVNSFANPVGIVPGDANTAGVSTFAARADHKHELPAWGVVGELAQISTTATAGTTAKFARIDHRHTLGANSVTAGTIAPNGISNENQFASEVVNTAAIRNGAVTKSKLAVDQQTPSGAIMAFAGTSAPAGWLFCDGSSYAVNAYPDLAAALNGRYGGSATPGQNFNVPDLRNRFPRGATTTGAAVSTTGSDEVQLVTAQLPPHAHGAAGLSTQEVANHQHGVSGGIGETNINHVHNANHGHGAYVQNGTSSSNIGPFGFVLTLTGASDTHQLMPPYWGGRPRDSGVEYTRMFLDNGTVIVLANNFNTDGMNTNIGHQHSLNTTSGFAGGHDHAITGNTAQTGASFPIDIRPRSVTVNYIIKT